MRLVEPKRLIPLIVALLAGGIVLASALVGPNPLNDLVLQIAQLLTTGALLLGIGHVLNVHRRRIAARATDWQYSIVLIAGLLLALVIGVLPALAGAGLIAFTLDLLRYVLQPLAVSVLALLTFFALRAAWRAFQLRPGEASIVLGVAVIFLLASGPWAALVPGLEESLAWVRAYPVLGVARGLLLGVGIGAIVASTRLLLGLDQPYLDR
jgi:cation transport ATPase